MLRGPGGVVGSLVIAEQGLVAGGLRLRVLPRRPQPQAPLVIERLQLDAELGDGRKLRAQLLMSGHGAPLRLVRVHTPARLAQDGSQLRLGPGQPAPALGKQGETFTIDPDAAGALDQYIVHAFQADGFVFQNLRHQIGGFVYIAATDDQQYPLLRTLDQAAGGFEDRRAGSFGAHESAGDVESVFGKKIVEVVARDAAGDVGKFLADEIGVIVGDLLESGVQLAGA